MFPSLYTRKIVAPDLSLFLPISAQLQFQVINNILEQHFVRELQNVIQNSIQKLNNIFFITIIVSIPSHSESVYFMKRAV